MGRRSFALPTADPHHQRQPSLGELHQELENEQEAQVNRLLHMIRLQQDQLAAIQRQNNGNESSPTNTEHSRYPTPPSTLPTPASTAITEQSSPRSSSVSHAQHPHFNRPHSLSRQSSARLSTQGTNSRGNSPALRPQSGSLGPLTEDFLLGGTRDDSAFYQAETQMLTRENQMLKLRIRELGKSQSLVAAERLLLSENSSMDQGCSESSNTTWLVAFVEWLSDVRRRCMPWRGGSSSRCMISSKATRSSLAMARFLREAVCFRYTKQFRHICRKLKLTLLYRTSSCGHGRCHDRWTGTTLPSGKPAGYFCQRAFCCWPD